MALAAVEAPELHNALELREAPERHAAPGAGTRRRHESFQALVLPHLDALHRGAWRLTRDPLTVQDLVQEALLKAWRAFDTFRNGSNIRAWLLRILTNTYIDMYRKDRREPEVVAEEHLDDLYLYNQVADSGTLSRTGDPADLVIETLMNPEVESALRALPEAFREAIILADVEGLTTTEIARHLGIPVGTVMSRLHRARGRLFRLLGDYARRQGYEVVDARRRPAPAQGSPIPGPRAWDASSNGSVA